MTTDLSVSVTCPPPEAPMNMLAIISSAANNPDVNVEKMERLLAMHRELQADQRRVAYQKAMKSVQADVQQVVRKSENKDNKSRFAKLEAVDAAIRPIYTKHGFSLSFGSKPSTAEGVVVTVRVMHEEGHFEDHELDGALDNTGMKGGATKTAIQGLGSTVSYLRRYLTCMVFNVVLTDEDNDGQGAPRLLSSSQRDMLIATLGDRHDAFLKAYDLADVGELGADQFDIAMAKAKAPRKA